MESETTKPVNVVSTEDAKSKVNDVEVVGNPDAWVLICKASSKSQKWMKSTKAMSVDGGVIIQVSTQVGDAVAEALTYVPDAVIKEEGGHKIIA